MNIRKMSISDLQIADMNALHKRAEATHEALIRELERRHVPR